MLKDKKLFLLDIDGTVCMGQQLISGTREFLKDVKETGRPSSPTAAQSWRFWKLSDFLRKIILTFR